MKKLLAFFVMTTTLGTTAMAANPFVRRTVGQLGVQFRSRIG